MNAKTFFADPYSSWQKGQIEYTNKLIRQYYPKTDEINEFNIKNIREIQSKINRRPRKNLGFETPINIFAKFVT
ncbi:MAG: IS30 family transposase [Flavobacteriaceae bacterium]|nr:IS30 family transposase [Flavobacteriaceae bacterium]